MLQNMIGNSAYLDEIQGSTNRRHEYLIYEYLLWNFYFVDFWSRFPILCPFFIFDTKCSFFSFHKSTSSKNYNFTIENYLSQHNWGKCKMGTALLVWSSFYFPLWHVAWCFRTNKSKIWKSIRNNIHIYFSKAN